VGADWATTAIDGVMTRQGAVHADQRGSFTELWRSSWTTFVQSNLSRSRAGVLRGMHFHRRQVDLWVLVEGRAMAATTDLRPLVDRTGSDVHSQVVEMSAGTMLLIPRLVAHGFHAVEDAALLYLVTNEYDGSDEHGFAWNDPQAAIPWQVADPILSERDSVNPQLAELELAPD
jgi:dTDP-4-dehydrorhamnose 3,5-epimerase